ncbi:MAG TPA: trehalose-6-phosphate synthase [Burkholderiaceae bacterium]|jgi:trehalose 6-phosphate synthase|nr:trehalose-6-phosphate synthase [Burkholderiaceae bacterium]
MGRLVVVSNRVADPRKPAAGGLAVAVGDALRNTGGLWFGWSGKVLEPSEGGAPGESGSVETHAAGDITLATIDLCRDDHDSFYLGYSNGVLWPVFHYRVDLANFDPKFLVGYRRVNRLFAQKLLPLLAPDDIVWVHDYHLIPLAAELRAMGSEHRIGFFLHIPLPPQQLMAALPSHEWLMRSLFSYDLVGLQTNTDLGHFERYAIAELGAQALGDGFLRAYGRTMRAGAYPIGIDVDEFQRMGESRDSRETYTNMREEYSKRRLLLGVDRLDYSKGLPHRVRAFREMLLRYPENHMSATLIQITPPSREDVGAYSDILHEVERLCGEINGNFGNLQWMPIRYIHRAVARKRIPGLCRACYVGLVTPLRDGMNLVAKEFIAAQDPADPGVLVLSRFAGAAEQLRDALLVNPYDVQGTAEAIQRALHMPMEERRARHRTLLETIRRFDIHWWSRNFLNDLESAVWTRESEAA